MEIFPIKPRNEKSFSQKNKSLNRTVYTVAGLTVSFLWTTNTKHVHLNNVKRPILIKAYLSYVVNQKTKKEKKEKKKEEKKKEEE